MPLPRALLMRAAPGFLSRATLSFLRFDLLRAFARAKRAGRSRLRPPHPRLHFGCGSTKIEGWLNVDLVGSDFDVDLTAPLPWRDDSFEVAMSQHVIEHLDLGDELVPLLRELRRVLTGDGELWLSCPDIEKICRSYLDHGMADLIEDRESRSRLYWDRAWSLDAEVGLEGVPSSHMVNSLFYQGFEHRNLFDFPLLAWTLRQAGFTDVERAGEAALRERFPEVPAREDDAQSLYVRARAGKAAGAREGG